MTPKTDTALGSVATRLALVSVPPQADARQDQVLRQCWPNHWTQGYKFAETAPGTTMHY